MDQFEAVLTKSGSAYEHLKRLAVGGMLRPDRRLAPTDLSAVFRVSVTPVRDALVRLAAEGYVRGESGRGYFSKPYTVEEQHDLYRVLIMGFLTCLMEVGRCSAERLRPSVAEFGTVAARADAVGADAGSRFRIGHDELLFAPAALSGSAIIPDLMRNAADRTQYIRELDAGRAERRAAMAARLAEIVEAALRDDVAGTIVGGRALVREFSPALPDLVRDANEQIGNNRFP